MTSDLQTIPNVGPAVARKLERLDIAGVDDLRGRDAYVDDPPAAREFYMQAFGLEGGFSVPSGDYAELDTGPTKLAFRAG